MGLEAFIPLCIPVAFRGDIYIYIYIYIYIQTETERERKESGEGGRRDTIFRGGVEKYISGFEGS
jgi:hypothetical protein